MTHHPLYCSVDWNRDLSDQDDCWEDTILLRAELEDLIHTNHVDFFIAGHLHFYERVTPTYQNRTVASAIDTPNYHKDANATIHIISGIAGNRKRHNDRLSLTP
jgi:hypothetical protein